VLGNAAHDQPAVYEEGRSDDHPEADALVHVPLIGGLAYFRSKCSRQNRSGEACIEHSGVVAGRRFRSLTVLEWEVDAKGGTVAWLVHDF
jgi:hypothetical protein